MGMVKATEKEGNGKCTCEKRKMSFFSNSALVLNRSSMHSVNVNFFKYDKQVFR